MIKIPFENKLLLVVMGLLLLTVSTGSGPARAADTPEIVIEALGGVEFDTATNTTTANTQAKLTDGQMTIEAERLVYNAVSGMVNASGSVKVTRNDGVFNTEELSYNVKNEMGSTGPFDALMYSPERNVKVHGSELDVNHDNYQFSKSTVTRCPLENPHYTLNAKKIILQGNKITVHQVVLKIRGIPVFYFPQLSFETDRADFPIGLDTGYNDTDGVWLKYIYRHRFNDNLLWYLSGKLVSNQVDSYHLIETGLTLNGKAGNGAYSDTIAVSKEINGFYKLADSFSLNNQIFSLAADGYYYDSTAKKNELGFSLTPNFRPDVLGKWQFTIQARRVAANEGNPEEYYGGVFGGYQINYQPVSNLSIGYARLDDFSGTNNYGDFSPNLGPSVSLGWGTSITDHSQISLSGAYNLDSQKLSGQINWKTCCYNASVGWDAVKQTINVGWGINF